MMIMKKAFIQIYDLAKDQLRKKSYLQEKEAAGRFMVKLSSNLDQWTEKDSSPHTSRGMRDPMRRKQSESSYPTQVIDQLSVTR